MSREPLDNRRFAVNKEVTHIEASGASKKVIITVGFDKNRRVKELFCADFKAGSETQAIVMDACVLASRLMQYGDAARDLPSKLCSPTSLIGSIIKAAADEDAPHVVNEETDNA